MAVMQPVLAGRHEHCYITATGYRSFDSSENNEGAGMRAAAEKIWGKDKLGSSMNQTMDARDMLGSEMYVVVDAVSSNRWRDQPNRSWPAVLPDRRRTT